MAVSAQELNVILSARDKEFTRAMDRASKRVSDLGKKALKTLTKLQKL